MSVTELEKAVRELPSHELGEFAKWFEDYMEEKWDRQIEEDDKAGKLDALVAKVKRDVAEGRVLNRTPGTK